MNSSVAQLNLEEIALNKIKLWSPAKSIFNQFFSFPVKCISGVGGGPEALGLGIQLEPCLCFEYFILAIH